MKAGEERDVSETREWYLKRITQVTLVKLKKHSKLIEVDGIMVDKYSECVLIRGFPFFVYATSPNKEEGEYHVGSPVAIEHLGLPHKVIVQLNTYHSSEWTTANVYHNGVVDKYPVRRCGPPLGYIKIKAYPCNWRNLEDLGAEIQTVMKWVR